MKKVVAIFAFLVAGPAVPATAYTDFVDIDVLNCRASPEQDAPVLLRLATGMRLTVRDTRHDWSLVDLNGRACWINLGLLSAATSTVTPGSETPPAAPSVPIPATIVPQTAPARTPPPATPRTTTRPARSYGGSSCPCSGRTVCIGPRGGRYCITSGGNKRYGV